MPENKHKTAFDRRKTKIRAKISGTATLPRMRVFKSNKNIYIQLIDDINGNTLIGMDDRKVKGKNKIEKAFKLGQELATSAIQLKLTQVVFDRGGYKYEGRVKSLADGARDGGLKI